VSRVSRPGDFVVQMSFVRAPGCEVLRGFMSSAAPKSDRTVSKVRSGIANLENVFRRRRACPGWGRYEAKRTAARTGRDTIDFR
jgi:hypothetical protein